MLILLDCDANPGQSWDGPQEWSQVLTLLLQATAEVVHHQECKDEGDDEENDREDRWKNERPISVSHQARGRICFTYKMW